MRDFVSHENTDLDLLAGEPVVITGLVGAGKTTFVEAITWCLWDRTRARTLDSLIRRGRDECSVTVVLDVDGKEARVTRSRARGRDSALTLIVDGQQDTRHTAAETKQAVLDLVGLDYDAALAGPLMLQKSVPFMQAQPRERKDLLIRLFGLDRWQAWEETAKARRDGALALVRASRAAIDAASPTLDDDIALMEQAFADAQARRTHAQAWLTENEPLLQEREREVAAMRERGSRLAGAQLTLKHAVTKFNEEKNTYDRLSSRLAEAQAAVANSSAQEPPAIDTAQLTLADEAHARAGQALADANAHLAAMKALRTFGEELVTCPHCDQTYHVREGVTRPGSDPVVIAETNVASMMEQYRESARPPAEMRMQLVAREVWERDQARFLSALDKIETAFEVQGRLMTELQEQGRAAKVEYDKARADTAGLPEAEASLEQMRQDTQAQRDVRERAQGDAQDHVRMLDRAHAERDRRDTAQEALREQETERGVWAELAQAFSRDGAPAMILDGLVPQIEQAANAVLARMPGGLSLVLRTQRALGTGKMAETLDAVIETPDGEESDYEMLSGGQQFRVDLALRIALTGLLAGRAADFLIVDEGLDRFQDDDGRRAVLDTLAQMRGEFGLLLAISHHREVVEFFDRRVEVEMEGGVSRIREAA